MIAFFFPIVLGALIGFTFDDGKINKSDFKHINESFEEGVAPLKKRASKIKKGFIKAVESIDAKSVPAINNLGDLS